MEMFYVLYIFMLFATFHPNAGILERMPKFHSVASASNEAIHYNFTCTMYSLPDGGFLQFHVNQRNADTLRFYNKTCFNRLGKCIDNTCSCSYNDFTFRWYYSASKTKLLNTFEVEITFVDTKLEKFQTLLSRTYNETAILDIDYEMKRFSNQANGYMQQKETPTNGHVGNKSYNGIVIASCTVIGCIVGILIAIFMPKMKRLGCFQGKHHVIRNTEFSLATELK